jgi:hypothetical protein
LLAADGVIFAFFPRCEWTYARGAAIIVGTRTREVLFMGDKSPKAKDKAKKQDTLNKNQKKAAALVKTSHGSAEPGKKGR